MAGYGRTTFSQTGGVPSPGIERKFATRLEGVEGIDYVATVADGLYRGARPSAEGVEWLQRLGVRTVVNLQGQGASEEKKAVAAAGMRYEWLPLKVSSAPQESSVTRFFEILEDASAYPVYVHCHLGVDRTGMMMALFRVRQQGWRNIDALAEMQHFNDHGYLDLRDYVMSYMNENRSRWTPSVAEIRAQASAEAQRLAVELRSWLSQHREYLHDGMELTGPELYDRAANRVETLCDEAVFHFESMCDSASVRLGGVFRPSALAVRARNASAELRARLGADFENMCRCLSEATVRDLIDGAAPTIEFARQSVVECIGYLREYASPCYQRVHTHLVKVWEETSSRLQQHAQQIGDELAKDLWGPDPQVDAFEPFPEQPRWHADLHERLWPLRRSARQAMRAVRPSSWQSRLIKLGELAARQLDWTIRESVAQAQDLPGAVRVRLLEARQMRESWWLSQPAGRRLRLARQLNSLRACAWGRHDSAALAVASLCCALPLVALLSMALARCRRVVRAGGALERLGARLTLVAVEPEHEPEVAEAQTAEVASCLVEEKCTRESPAIATKPRQQAQSQSQAEVRESELLLALAEQQRMLDACLQENEALRRLSLQEQQLDACLEVYETWEELPAGGSQHDVLHAQQLAAVAAKPECRNPLTNFLDYFRAGQAKEEQIAAVATAPGDRRTREEAVSNTDGEAECYFICTPRDEDVMTGKGRSDSCHATDTSNALYLATAGACRRTSSVSSVLSRGQGVDERTIAVAVARGGSPGTFIGRGMVACDTSAAKRLSSSSTWASSGSIADSPTSLARTPERWQQEPLAGVGVTGGLQGPVWMEDGCWLTDGSATPRGSTPRSSSPWQPSPWGPRALQAAHAEANVLADRPPAGPRGVLLKQSCSLSEAEEADCHLGRAVGA